jgi:hypothetical protein
MFYSVSDRPSRIAGGGCYISPLFFRIDYEDRNTGARSFDPADAEKTRRVMTILLAEEWGL